MRKTLILDCDGVLYPTTQISLRDFVSAMKETAQERGISKTEYNTASQTSLDKKALGMFNFVRELTKGDDKAFDDFCSDMFNKIDYSKITREDQLLKDLKDVQKTHDIVILTNNHMAHLDKVLQARFGETVDTIGIPCFDIKSTRKGDIFYPKQSNEGLVLFAQRLGKKPSECTLIDDAPANIKAAKAVGMGGVLISQNYTLSDYCAFLKTPYTKPGHSR